VEGKPPTKVPLQFSLGEGVDGGTGPPTLTPTAYTGPGQRAEIRRGDSAADESLNSTQLAR